VNASAVVLAAPVGSTGPLLPSLPRSLNETPKGLPGVGAARDGEFADVPPTAGVFGGIYPSFLLFGPRKAKVKRPKERERERERERLWNKLY
jgi:hypothetical protein